MDAELKKKLNTLTKLIRKEIQAIQENSWLQFCKKIEKKHTSMNIGVNKKNFDYSPRAH